MLLLRRGYGVLWREYGNQNDDQRYHTFSNHVLHGIFCKAIRFIWEWKLGIVLLPNKMSSDNTGATEETSATVLAQETSAQKIPPCYMLEVYGETTIFIRVNITENVIKSVP